MKRPGVVFSILFVIFFFTSSGLHAQADQCTPSIQTLFYGYPWGWIPINPAGNASCFSFLWMAYCQVPTPACPPKNKDKRPCGPDCGSPISLADGNTYIEQTDARLPGLGGGLVLTRRWNS